MSFADFFWLHFYTMSPNKIRFRKKADFVCIIHFSLFIIHYSLNESGF